MSFGHLVDQNEKSDDYDRLPKGVKNEDLPSYEKVMGWEPSHPMLKRLKKEFNTAKKSDQEKPLILLEGKRIIQDAMNAGFYPKTFVFSRLNLLGDIPFDTSKNINMVQIPYKNIKVWSDLSTSPGIMGKYFVFTLNNNYSSLSIITIPTIAVEYFEIVRRNRTFNVPGMFFRFWHVKCTSKTFYFK